MSNIDEKLNEHIKSCTDEELFNIYKNYGEEYRKEVAELAGKELRSRGKLEKLEDRADKIECTQEALHKYEKLTSRKHENFYDIREEQLFGEGRCYTAVCDRCKARIMVAKDRGLSRYFGPSDQWCCEKCGAFLRGTPGKAVVEGLIETVIAMAAMVFFAVRWQKTGSGYLGLFFAGAFYYTIDGIRKIYNASVSYKT